VREHQKVSELLTNGGPGGNSKGGQPPQKPTDASGNELKMPQAPSKESSE